MTSAHPQEIDTVERAAASPDQPQPFRELGLKEDEYQRIREILGRPLEYFLGLKGAAKDSFHMKAMAADVRLKSRNIGQISGAAFACNGGGVGIYRRSNFVHMDCGPVRSWRG